MLTKPLPTALYNQHKDKLLNGFNGKTVEQTIDSDIEFARIITITSLPTAEPEN